MCRKLVLLVVVLGVIIASSSAASAAIITNVVRANGQSYTSTNTALMLQTTPPRTYDGSEQPLKGDYPEAGNWGWQLTGTNRVFSDRAGHNWNSPTNVIPPELLNSEYVRTFNADKAAGESNVTYAMTISRAATVWITIDDRSTTTTAWGTTAPWGATSAPASLQVVANWVTDAFAAPGTFTDSGLNLLIWESTTESARSMSVFWAVLPAGTYTFGEMSSGRNFYTIGTLPPLDNASGPNPRDGAIKQPRTVTLQWQPGAKAAQHKVWFGTDCGSMTLQATLPRGTETYTKTGLDYLTTYYWAVDEVNEPNTWALPDCWSFMTVVDTNTVIDVNLVGYWKFDGDASDSSGYKNHGTLMGTAALVPGGPVTFGEVLELYDQADSLVNCGNSPFLAIPSMAQNLTVSAWVKSRNGTFNEDGAPFVTKRGEDNLGWQLRKHGGQNWATFTVRGTSGDEDPDSLTGITIMDNEWHCLVGTYNGIQRRLYVDGSVDIMIGDTGNIADAPLDNVAIGAKYRYGSTATPPWMWGQIDEVRIYNRALSQAEVDELLERYVAYDPTPGNGAQNAAITTNLSWTAGADVSTQKVYFGTDKNSLPKVAEPGAGTTTWDPPGDLAYCTKYYWTVTEVNAVGTEYISETWNFRTGADPATSRGQILREFWWVAGGGGIANLLNYAAFPDNPDETALLNIFEYPDYPATTWREQYGCRTHGWLYPGKSGNYTFWITSDDNSRLYLSTDMTPENATQIADVTASASPRNYSDPDVHPSVPIYLEGAKRYYISALHKEGTGGDNMAVSWQGPETNDEREVIAGCFLSPFVKLWPNRPSPADKSADQPRIVTLQWTAGIDEALGAPNTIQRVYIGTDAASVAAAVPGSPQDKGLTADPNEFGPITKNFCERVYWKVVETDSASNLYSSPVWSYKVIYDAALVPDPNLVLWYKFDGDAGDSSGHGSDGTENGGPTYGGGYDGEAISLDGVDDWVAVEFPVGISGSAPRTIAGWAKARTTAIPDWTTVFGFSPATGAANLYFDIERRGGQNQYCIHVHGFQDNIMPIDLEWHHLAATYDEPTTTISWYGDGVFVDSNNTRVLATIDSVKVGRRGDRQTYFPGLVDDVRIYDYALTDAEIALIMRVNLAWAWNESPKNRATGVSIEPVLTWTPGDYAPPANGHWVYFGDDPANMALVTTPHQPQTPNNYTPSALDVDTTYYWAVDEANAAAPGGVNPGRIWRFTTINNKVVDDFETYEDKYTVPAPQAEDVNWIYYVYTDGFGDLACTEGSGNGSGAKIGDLWRSGHDGSSLAMTFLYDNDGLVTTPKDCNELEPPVARAHYSKAEALVAKLDSDIGSDWTVSGVKALSLWFSGDPSNSIEPMWVQLTDSSNRKAKVFYDDKYADEDINDMNEASWHEWLIDLVDFAPVEINDVNSIAIGVGDEDATSGVATGTLYFDDIRLYTPICVLTRRATDFAALDYVPAGNPAGDCVINARELEVMTRDWLMTDTLETGELLVQWAFNEGAGVIASDNSGNGRVGDINDSNGLSWVNDPTRGWCLDFQGGDSVLDNDANTYLNGLRGLTIAVWVKNRELNPTDQGFIIFQNPTGNDDRDMRYDALGGNADPDGQSVIKCGVTTTSTVGQPIQQIESSEYAQTTNWQHLALTWSTGEQIKLYINGVLDTPTANRAGTYGVTTGATTLIVGKGGKDNAVNRGWNGLIDDVRIYNFALTPAEIATVKAGGSVPSRPVHYPTLSPAEIGGDEAQGSMVINFEDYAVLVTRWLDEDLFP
jgi:hypothetical protein